MIESFGVEYSNARRVEPNGNVLIRMAEGSDI